jgi:hypothetical protein
MIPFNFPILKNKLKENSKIKKELLKLIDEQESGELKQNMDRVLVFMTYLNDVKDGGTHFKYQKVTTPAIKGLTIIWPPDWTHTHKGQISDDKKIIATGWFRLI